MTPEDVKKIAEAVVQGTSLPFRQFQQAIASSNKIAREQIARAEQNQALPTDAQTRAALNSEFLNFQREYLDHLNALTTAAEKLLPQIMQASR